MDSSAPFQLPTFDEMKSASPLYAFDDQPHDENIDEIDAEDSPSVELEMEAVEDLPPADDIYDAQKDVQEALECFSAAIHQAEASVVEQVSFVLQDVVAALFPHLSAAFLADEFALHVPDLAKLAPATVQVQASPPIAEKLELASQKMDTWPAGWSISAVDGLAETSVQVAWGQGGLTYETDKILAACLGRSNDHKTNIAGK